MNPQEQDTAIRQAQQLARAVSDYASAHTVAEGESVHAQAAEGLATEVMILVLQARQAWNSHETQKAQQLIDQFRAMLPPLKRWADVVLKGGPGKLPTAGELQAPLRPTGKSNTGQADPPTGGVDPNLPQHRSSSTDLHGVAKQPPSGGSHPDPFAKSNKAPGPVKIPQTIKHQSANTTKNPNPKPNNAPNPTKGTGAQGGQGSQTGYPGGNSSGGSGGGSGESSQAGEGYRGGTGAWGKQGDGSENDSGGGETQGGTQTQGEQTQGGNDGTHPDPTNSGGPSPGAGGGVVAPDPGGQSSAQDGGSQSANGDSVSGGIYGGQPINDQGSDPTQSGNESDPERDAVAAGQAVPLIDGGSSGGENDPSNVDSNSSGGMSAPDPGDDTGGGGGEAPSFGPGSQSIHLASHGGGGGGPDPEGYGEQGNYADNQLGWLMGSGGGIADDRGGNNPRFDPSDMPDPDNSGPNNPHKDVYKPDPETTGPGNPHSFGGKSSFRLRYNVAIRNTQIARSVRSVRSISKWTNNK